MASLPRWNSIKGTTSFRNFFGLSGIALLLIVVVFEFLAFSYRQRENRLVEAAAIERQQQHDAEVVTLRRLLSDADRKVAALEAQKAERRLSQEEMHTLTAALSPFPGQKISIQCILGDIYGKELAGDFIAVMKDAGWDYGGGEGVTQGIFGRNPEGIVVLINDTDEAAHKASGGVLELVHTLLDLHLIPAPAVIGDRDIPRGAVRLIIGKGLPQPVL